MAAASLPFPRQVADILAHRNDRPGNKQLFVFVLVFNLEQAGGERQQRFARTCLAGERDERNIVIQQQLQRHPLLSVARGNSPDGIIAQDTEAPA